MRESDLASCIAASTCPRLSSWRRLGPCLLTLSCPLISTPDPGGARLLPLLELGDGVLRHVGTLRAWRVRVDAQRPSYGAWPGVSPPGRPSRVRLRSLGCPRCYPVCGHSSYVNKNSLLVAHLSHKAYVPKNYFPNVMLKVSFSACFRRCFSWLEPAVFSFWLYTPSEQRIKAMSPARQDAWTWLNVFERVIGLDPLKSRLRTICRHQLHTSVWWLFARHS